ncbi:MAG TPA: twin-arginine translocase TatA/TatE family subunit [Sphingomicrobium sp.]|jgi:sec-independent protein translocase protein TatA|nr:twin-arginine translocase TatA/TatE family subunit [Sphingomicrobium sp.]
MGGLSLWHWLVVIILVLLLFGRGRISDMMGDIGKGLKSFKQGMAEDEDKAKPTEPRQLPREQQPIDITPKQPAEPATPPSPGDETPRS